MKNAESQVKGGNYKAALDSYLGIYAQYRNIAAARNASILHEALGNTEDAASLMRTVYAETGDAGVRDELTRLNEILEDRAIIASGFSDP